MKKQFPSDHIRIADLHKDEYDEVATLLTDAFEDNPAYALIFTEKSRLREGLFWLFKANLFLINRNRPVTKVVKNKRSDKVIGVYSILPPGGVKVAFTDYLQIGLPGFIRRFGFRTLHKMLGMDSYNKQLLTNAIGTKKYYYVSMVVVKEKYRGTGIGSYMVKGCLDELRNRKRSTDIVGLTTQLPENVTFYSRLGFEKLDEGVVRFGKDQYYNYNMMLKLI